MYEYERQHLERLRALAPECMVLLKRKGDFPLSEPCKLALYGSGARRTIKGGTGSGDVNSRFYVTAERGLEEAGFTLTTKSWMNAYDTIYDEAKEQFIADIKREAREKHMLAVMYGMGAVMPEPAYILPMDGEGDTAIYVLSRISGEGNDRNPISGDLLLTQTEIRDILAAHEKYEHFLLVLNVGGPVDLTPVQAVENILLLSQLGAVTGTALADVVLGRAYPSGKLSTTWAAWEDYPQLGTFGEPEDTRYNDGIYVGYRYFDSAEVTPIYPFGFGLGYTDFTLGEAETAVDATAVTVTVPVQNTGRAPGRETVQVYVSVPWGKLDQPRKTLAAFAKTAELKAGERCAVTASFAMEDIASFDEETCAWILEEGFYTVRVGASSADTKPVAILHLEESVTVRQVNNVGGRPDFADWQPEPPLEELPANLPVLTLDAAAFAALKWPEAPRWSDYARGVVSALSDEQLLYLSMGLFSKGPASIIGNAAQHVAGAAGETYGKIPGLPGLILADGPAGLRLNRQYTRDRNGVPHGLGSALPAGMEDFLPGIARAFLNRGAKEPRGEVYDQYCTAIPIGTALAQSWNPDLLTACGDIVGAEMERFGVHLWLAPAFNIHRSVLCGRNFEYYSEDPLLAGKLAAAITRGVQAHPGRGVTIKHFCCNNQERNRLTSNSIVSQRALRETYLRAFQICIRESDPAALMTSYNLLNGIHTSERKDLLQTLLREEWGFRGLIMTDWVVPGLGTKGKHRMAMSAPSIGAGNLYMPGGQGDYNGALRAMRGKNRHYTLTRQEAENCALQVVETVLRLTGDRT